MKNVFIILFVVFITVTFSGCNSYKYGASQETATESNLTFGVVKSKVTKEETTQEEILKLFGSPNITTKNKSNNEVWSYNKMSAVEKGGQTSFFTGSKGSASSSTESFDLIITFDDNDVVKDYSVVSTRY